MREYNKLTQNYRRPSNVGVKIERVMFKAPATIVFWSDGSKTVVKASNNDEFDAEKGLAMAIAKMALGNTGSYYNTFKKFLEE